MPLAVFIWRGDLPSGCRRGLGWWIWVRALAACSASSHRSLAAGRTGRWSMRTQRCWMMRSAARRRGHGGSISRRRPTGMRCWYPRRAGCGGCRRCRVILAMRCRALPLPLREGGRGRGPAPTGPADVDAIVCSALLDLVSARYLERLFEQLAVPFLACLTVDGRDAWLPHHPSDAPVRAAFRRDQQRDKGFGPALGTAAPAFALRSLAARGFVTASAPSDWRIPRTALRMQRALIEGRGMGDATWQEARLRQAMRGRLAITIGHRDILAFPPGG